MLYIIGLGLNEKGISLEGLELLKKCQKIYLENYTVDFPYSFKKLESIINKKIIFFNRDDVESEKLIHEAKKENIALLVYGSPLFATTHISLVSQAKENNIKLKFIFSASIFDAIAQTGLQLYKFGKILSMPKWKKNFQPSSFLESIQENKKISLHSLILIDIGLSFKDSVKQLEIANKKHNFDLNNEKIIVCSSLGTHKSKILYAKLNKLKNKKILQPFCFIIPSKLHFLEKEILESFKISKKQWATTP